jgi:hypothetical protein
MALQIKAVEEGMICALDLPAPVIAEVDEVSEEI